MAEGKRINIQIDKKEMDTIIKNYDCCKQEAAKALQGLYSLETVLGSLYEGKACDAVSGTMGCLEKSMYKLFLLYDNLSRLTVSTCNIFTNVDSAEGEQAGKAVQTTTPGAN